VADLFRGRSQLLVYHFMFEPDYTAGVSVLFGDRGRFQRLRLSPREPRRRVFGGVPGSAFEAAGVQTADGVDVSLGIFVRHRLQLRLQRFVHREATAHGVRRLQLPVDGRDAGPASRPQRVCQPQPQGSLYFIVILRLNGPRFRSRSDRYPKRRNDLELAVRRSRARRLLLATGRPSTARRILITLYRSASSLRDSLSFTRLPRQLGAQFPAGMTLPA
jgi:hypothetical protein